MIKYYRNTLNKRRRQTGPPGQPMQGIAPLPSTQSEHDFHKFGIHPNSVAPGFHFHLAASINPDTGKIFLCKKLFHIYNKVKELQKY